MYNRFNYRYSPLCTVVNWLASVKIAAVAVVGAAAEAEAGAGAVAVAMAGVRTAAEAFAMI